MDAITESMEMSLSKPWETVKDREACMLQFMGLQRIMNDLVTEQQKHDTDSEEGKK